MIEWVSLPARGGEGKVPESGARMEGAELSFSRECPDGEGVASAGE